MATNQAARWIKNLQNSMQEGPMLVPAKFGAGTTAVKVGEMLESTANTNTEWIPVNSDFDMTAAFGSGGKLLIAATELKSGDLAGYYQAWCPVPGDVWEFALSAAAAVAFGTALYWSDSETVATSGNNIIAYSSGWDNYQLQAGNASDDASIDLGTTVKSISRVRLTFREAVSFYSHLQRA